MAASVLLSSRISNTLLLVYVIDSGGRKVNKQCRAQNPLYLSMSVSREESRKPLANGLLSIFSLVIWKTQQVRDEGKFSSSFYSTYSSLTILFSLPSFLHLFFFSLLLLFLATQSQSVCLNMLLPAAWLSTLMFSQLYNNKTAIYSRAT